MIKPIKFEVVFLDECTYHCRSLEDVYETILLFHGSFILANYIKSVCAKTKSGDVLEYRDIGLIIECK